MRAVEIMLVWTFRTGSEFCVSGVWCLVCWCVKKSVAVRVIVEVIVEDDEGWRVKQTEDT